MFQINICFLFFFLFLHSLHNLLKQFGGYQEYIQYNTDVQNKQQLKNFDLSEYRQVIYEMIILMHGVLLRQVQESIKQFIVPAILDHDETARGKSRGRTMSLDMSPEQSREPKSLVQQLDIFYKHLTSFGMETYYIEQIFKQVGWMISLTFRILRQQIERSILLIL